MLMSNSIQMTKLWTMAHTIILTIMSHSEIGSNKVLLQVTNVETQDIQMITTPLSNGTRDYYREPYVITTELKLLDLTDETRYLLCPSLLEHTGVVIAEGTCIETNTPPSSTSTEGFGSCFIYSLVYILIPAILFMFFLIVKFVRKNFTTGFNLSKQEPPPVVSK